MRSKELFDAGKLNEAIQAATEDVRNKPTDGRSRTFLFELLCFTGDIERTNRQLDVIGHQDESSQWGAQVYRNILEAEQKRRQLFQQGRAPEFLGEAPDYVRWQIDAIAQLARQQPAAAKEQLQRVEEARPALRGRRGEDAFEDFRDCDDLLGSCLEFVVVADYVWVPLELVEELEVMPPERPRDLLWPAGRILLRDGTQRRGYFFALYPGSHEHADDQVRLGRMTDWREGEEGIVTGAGQKLFLAGEHDYPLLSLGTITFDRRDSATG